MLRSVCTTPPIRLGLGAVLLGTVFASAPASAAEGPTIGIVGLHQAELTTEDQQRAVAGIAAAIEATGRFDALVGDEVIRTIQGREKIILEDGLLASARQALANGRNAYNQASPEDAIAHLESAIEDFRFGMPATNTVEELWEAWVYLGSSQLQKDPPDEAGARAAFVNAVAISPSRPVNPALFPPNVVEAFDAVKAEMATKPTTLAISITPQVTGAIRVWVDGVDRGPAARVDVPPGEHHVMVRGAGTQGYARVEVPIPPTLDVPPEEGGGEAPAPDAPAPEAPAPEAPEPVLQQVAITLDLPSLGEAARSPAGRAAQIGGLYRALGNRAEGMNYVLVAGVDGASLYLQVLDPETDTFSKAMEVPFTGAADDEAVQSVPLLLNVVDPQGRFTATAPTPAPIAIGTNSVLALQLTQPRTVSAAVGPVATKERKVKEPKAEGGKSKVGVVLGVIGGVVVAGAASGTIYALTRDTDPTGTGPGTVVVQF